MGLRLMAKLAPLLLTAVSCGRAAQPTVIFLWTNGAPGFEGRRNEPELSKDYWIRNIHNPSLTVFFPVKEKANGAAVLICPGGGHRELVFQAEGVDPAHYLNGLGITAFVLKYRLGREQGSPYSIQKQPLEDAQRAIRLIRTRAADWNLDTNRIGALGFSAGGEVVSMLAYNPPEGDTNASDPIDRLDCALNFQIVIYPGPLGIPEVLPTNAPPAFFLVANDDKGHVEPVISLLEKYRRAQRPVEAHLLARGGHGFNMGARAKFASVQGWPQRMADWLADSHFLE